MRKNSDNFPFSDFYGFQIKDKCLVVGGGVVVVRVVVPLVPLVAFVRDALML